MPYCRQPIGLDGKFFSQRHFYWWCLSSRPICLGYLTAIRWSVGCNQYRIWIPTNLQYNGTQSIFFFNNVFGVPQGRAVRDLQSRTGIMWPLATVRLGRFCPTGMVAASHIIQLRGWKPRRAAVWYAKKNRRVVPAVGGMVALAGP